MTALNNISLQQLMREIRKTILDDISEAMHNLGFIGGSKIDAGKLVGQVPVGNARFIVQKDGVQVGEAIYILNFIGAGIVVTADPANNRVNISLAFANGPDDLIADDLSPIIDDASAPVFAG